MWYICVHWPETLKNQIQSLRTWASLRILNCYLVSASSTFGYISHLITWKWLIFRYFWSSKSIKLGDGWSKFGENCLKRLLIRTLRRRCLLDTFFNVLLFKSDFMKWFWVFELVKPLFKLFDKWSFGMTSSS